MPKLRCLAPMCLLLVGLVWVISASTVIVEAWQPAAQEEFVPIDQLPPEDRLPAAPLLIAAYSFVWVALLGYLWVVWRRLGSVEQQLHDVERRLAERSDR